MANTPTQSNGQKATYHTDEVVIIGAGLAGLYLALKLAPRPALLIAAKKLGSGASSLWAQGGIAAAMGEGDTPQSHAEDTIAAGAGLVDRLITEGVTEEAPSRIIDLLEYGVPFDKDLEGRLQLTKEGAHSEKRIVHVQGDQAGSAIMAALLKAVKATKSIRIWEQIEAHGLAAENNTITGVHLWPSSKEGQGESTLIKADHIVLATGGVGHLYDTTTNPTMARGEGLAMAARIGAVIRDPEFVQFHPTAMDVNQDPAPLATEALRGEGAHLIDQDDTRFMCKIHDQAELSPRDIVARAVHQQRRSGKGAYLDCRGTLAARMPTHFPTVYNHCKTASIDPATTPIPVAPAAHFHMGGIKTDAKGRTSIAGLWACGEVASTGLHGANRLASNSLLEAVVYAKRIADDISNLSSAPSKTASQKKINRPEVDHIFNNTKDETNSPSHCDLAAPIKTLRTLMAAHVGVLRDQEGLNTAERDLKQLADNHSESQLFQNMCLTARLITSAASHRQTNCGSHFRADASKTNNDGQPAKHTECTVDREGNITLKSKAKTQ